MAFGLPILFMIFTGVFWVSIALYQKLQLAEAISVGGRYLAVDRGDTDPCATAASSIYAAAPGLQRANLTLSFTINGVATGASCPGSAAAANANMVSGANAANQRFLSVHVLNSSRLTKRPPPPRATSRPPIVEVVQ